MTKLHTFLFTGLVMTVVWIPRFRTVFVIGVKSATTRGILGITVGNDAKNASHILAHRSLFLILSSFVSHHPRLRSQSEPGGCLPPGMWRTKSHPAPGSWRPSLAGGVRPSAVRMDHQRDGHVFAAHCQPRIPSLVALQYGQV